VIGVHRPAAAPRTLVASLIPSRIRLDRPAVPVFSPQNTVFTGCSAVESAQYRLGMGSSLLFSRGAGLAALVAFGCLTHPLTSSADPRRRPDQQTTVPAKRVFGSDAGMVLNFIKPEKTADFEAVIAKLKEALAKSPRSERAQQARSWKVFRSVEPAANKTVLYLFVIDPAVRGADYTVSTILAEAFPDDVQALYKQYVDAYATGQNFVNLSTVQALGEADVSTK
jgi:hypothetical protein